jgi:nucleotide-binding universal stress UspA family protein
MRVLIATDGSKFGDAAVNEAATRAWPQGSELKIISVIERPAISYVTSGEFALAIDQIAKEVRQDSENIALRAAQVLQQVGLNASFIVKEGAVAESIIDEAKHWDADLIIIGTHGRKGLSRFFIGSVALRVATHSPCSVEIVKLKGEPDK